MTTTLRRASRAAALRLGSIRGRLMLWYVVLFAAALAGYSLILVATMARGLNGGLDRVLVDEAGQATGVLDTVLSEQDLKLEFKRINVGAVIGLYDANGQLLAGRTLPPPLDAGLLGEAAQPGYQTLAVQDGTSWRVLVQRVARDSQPDRWLVVGRSTGFVRVAIDQLLMQISVSAPLVMLLAIAGGIFLAGRALDPIDQITRTADAISADDLSRRLNLPTAQDEVGRLAATFDRMLERLHRAFDQQRRFTADASHELRTPLAMLVSRAGLALERPRSATEYEATLTDIRDEGLHMGRIVNQLLTLARADAGEQLVFAEPLEVGELVLSVVDAMLPLAQEHGIALTARTDANLSVLGDQTRLMQLLVNLVENALNHTPAGGSVRVRAAREAKFVTLRVEDTGSGIPPEQLPHVFERFFRGDRGARRDQSGAGLGLSLCLAIARAHNGDIRIASQVGTGTQVVVRVPFAAADTRSQPTLHTPLTNTLH